jgi:hypothetical protein
VTEKIDQDKKINNAKIERFKNDQTSKTNRQTEKIDKEKDPFTEEFYKEKEAY